MTATPWKETRELQARGYKIVRSSTTEATLQKVEPVDAAPTLSHTGRYKSFERAQQLFQSHHIHFKEWCKWDFSRSRPLTSIEDIKSTLAVWDDLWEPILSTMRDPELIYPYSEVLQTVYTEMKPILEYAIDHENIHVFTDYEIDY